MYVEKRLQRLCIEFIHIMCGFRVNLKTFSSNIICFDQLVLNLLWLLELLIIAV